MGMAGVIERVVENIPGSLRYPVLAGAYEVLATSPCSQLSFGCDPRCACKIKLGNAGREGCCPSHLLSKNL
jgi:hypothetical protein